MTLSEEKPDDEEIKVQEKAATAEKNVNPYLTDQRGNDYVLYHVCLSLVSQS